MTKAFYDIVIVGGGIGGSAFAQAMAKSGYRVLVVEREDAFRDRVRGEGMHAWGVPEARALGIYDAMSDGIGTEVRWWDIYVGSQQFAHRDFVETTPHCSPLFSFYHPEMQTELLEVADQAGAEVRRGASVRNVSPGAAPTVTITQGDWTTEVEARFVVGADGRNSPTRKWAGFEVKTDPEDRLFTGVLLEQPDVPEDTWLAYMNPDNGLEAMVCNIGAGRVRAYLGHPRSAGLRVAKAANFDNFRNACIQAGAPSALYDNACVAGPMASFAADDVWVEHPFANGVALLGDAASTCDPTFGQGLALTLRSARILRDCLTSTDDWDAAGNAYATEQHRQFTAIRTLESWYRKLFLESGAEADERRCRAFPLIAEEMERVPDLFGLGPEAPTDERARMRFFGEA